MTTAQDFAKMSTQDLKELVEDAMWDQAQGKGRRSWYKEARAELDSRLNDEPEAKEA
jgi:hypothetical protein